MPNERGPSGGAGELTALVKEWRRVSRLTAIGDSTMATYRTLGACADELERALAAKSPQGVPAANHKRHCTDSQRCAACWLRCIKQIFASDCGYEVREAEICAVLSNLRTVGEGHCSIMAHTNCDCAPKPAPTDALHVGDELDALAEDIDRNGLMAATPAPGAETALEAALKDIERRHCSCDMIRGYTCTLHEKLQRVREALAAAPPAPSDAIMREKEITVANHIREAANDGCQCEPCVAAHHASAERVRQVVTWYRKGVKPLLVNMSELNQKILTRWIAQMCDEVERVLPPSTGEKHDGTKVL